MKGRRNILIVFVLLTTVFYNRLVYCQDNHLAELKKNKPSHETAFPKDSNREQKETHIPVWSGQSGGFDFVWIARDIRIQTVGENPTTRYSFLDRTRKLYSDAWKAFCAKQLDEKNKSMFDKYAGEFNHSCSILSIVGTIISIQTFDDGYCTGAAHPSAYTAFSVIDARIPEKKVSLTDFFKKSDVFKALLSDKVVKEALDDLKNYGTPKNLEKLLELLSRWNVEGGSEKACDYHFSGDMLERFSFHHIERNQVAIRIGLSHGCEAKGGSLTQIAVLLGIPDSLKKPLLLANARKEGFLMKDSASISQGKEARITLFCDPFCNP